MIYDSLRLGYVFTENKNTECLLISGIIKILPGYKFELCG